MKTLKEFFKNRINVGDYNDDIGRLLDSHNFTLKHLYSYKIKEINPLSLNITNSLDLIEKLKPLLCFTTSHLEKFKSVNNNSPYDTLEIIAGFDAPGPVKGEVLFKIKFKLTHENIFHKINLCIKKEIKKRTFIFAFTTKPIKLYINFKVFRPFVEARGLRRIYNEERRLQQRYYNEQNSKKSPITFTITTRNSLKDSQHRQKF